MRTTKLIGLGLFAALALGGCATPGEMTDRNLLTSYAMSRWNPLVGGEQEKRAEILRRGLVTEEELARADQYDVKIGDTQEQVLAAFGMPNERSNLEVSGAVYQTWGWPPEPPRPTTLRRVYLRNGIVTGISR